MILIDLKTQTTLVAFIFLWIAEGVVPFYGQFKQGFHIRLQHDARNLGMGVFNALITGVLFTGLFAGAEQWTKDQAFGLMHWVGWPPLIKTVVAGVLLDVWMYLWHRANHVIPLLWRFHRMHHSDLEMDAASARQ